MTDDLLESIARRFPQLIDNKRLPSGSVGPELPFDAAAVQRLFTAGATERNQGTQLWTKDDSELLVHTGKVTVSIDEGLIVLTIPVSCDQARDASVQVPFAVGSQDRPTGLIVATEERPRGPSQVVDVWAESLTAFAWRTLMAIVTRVAAHSGIDQDRAALIPVSLTASRDGLRVLTMARHAFDRVIK